MEGRSESISLTGVVNYTVLKGKTWKLLKTQV